jgi:hypothetical protein
MSDIGCWMSLEKATRHLRESELKTARAKE